MGRRGPAPTPTALKVLRGTAKPKLEEPQPHAGPLEPPSDLDAGARTEWRRVLGELGSAGVIKPVDEASLRIYCEAVVRYRQAALMLAGSAPLVRGGHGELVRNPLHQIVRDNAVLVRLFARELGLTPSARVGLVAPSEQSLDTITDIRRRIASRRSA